MWHRNHVDLLFIFFSVSCKILCPDFISFDVDFFWVLDMKDIILQVTLVVTLDYQM